MKPRLEAASGECPGDLGAGAELAALQEGVDFALGSRLREAIFGRELRRELGLAVERGDILLGEVAPLRTDVLHDEHLGVLLERRRLCRNIRCV
jgi:hypothetical protein